MRITEDTIEVTVISQCAECDTEIKRVKKIYSLKDFNFMSKLQPNYYFKDASSGDYFIMVRPICEVCRT